MICCPGIEKSILLNPDITKLIDIINGRLINMSTYTEVFGMYYLSRFIDEDHGRVLRFNGSLFVQSDYLEEM